MKVNNKKVRKLIHRLDIIHYYASCLEGEGIQSNYKGYDKSVIEELRRRLRGIIDRDDNLEEFKEILFWFADTLDKKPNITNITFLLNIGKSLNNCATYDKMYYVLGECRKLEEEKEK